MDYYDILLDFAEEIGYNLSMSGAETFRSAAPSRLQTSSAMKRAKACRREKKTLLLKSKRWSTTSNFFGMFSVDRHSVTAVPFFLCSFYKIGMFDLCKQKKKNKRLVIC